MTTSKFSRFPKKFSELENLQNAIDKFVLSNPSKEHKFLSECSVIVTQGSCFAAEIYKALKESNFNNVEYFEFTEALNSPIANEMILKEAENNFNHPLNISLRKADIFILTLGLSACWFSKETGEFYYNVSANDVNKFNMRTISVEETKNSLLNIYKSIFNINNKIKLIITLSPVPLNATWEFNSIFIADCISKSTLRSAIHESISDYKLSNFIEYFPSFEIIKWLGPFFGKTFGDDNNESHNLPRAIQPYYVKEIIKSFKRNYSE